MQLGQLSREVLLFRWRAEFRHNLASGGIEKFVKLFVERGAIGGRVVDDAKRFIAELSHDRCADAGLISGITDDAIDLLEARLRDLRRDCGESDHRKAELVEDPNRCHSHRRAIVGNGRRHFRIGADLGDRLDADIRLALIVERHEFVFVF